MDLTSYDWIVISSSAGKDSQAMLDEVVRQADAQGVDRARLVVVHANLGRMEWSGTGELARAQAEHYGLRFEIVKREKGDILAQADERGKWPSSTCRYCTSDHKRDQIAKLYTRLANESNLDRPVRILECIGLRAEESPARAKKEAFTVNKRATNKTRRHVWTWLPVLDWTEAEVWTRIHESGVEHHRAYDLGMPRLSCIFCIFAPKSCLMLAGFHNREVLAECVEIEERIDHQFKKDLSLGMIQDALEAGELPPDTIEVFNAQM